MKKAFLILFGIAVLITFLEAGVAGLMGLRLLAIPLLIGGLIALWAYHLKKPSELSKLLSEGKLQQAWMLAETESEKQQIREWMEAEMELPCEALRYPMLSLYDNLETLNEIDSNPETALMGDFAQDTQRSYGAMWAIIEKLQGVSRQKIAFAADHPRMVEIYGQLEGLSNAATNARVRIAEATLEGTGSLDEELLIATRTLERQTESLSSLQGSELE